MTKKIDKPVSLQKGLDQLEKIVSEFEREDLDLEKAIPKFKQAIKLASELKKQVQSLENEIKKI